MLLNLIRELRRQGLSVDLVAFRPDGEADFPECEELWQGIDPLIIGIPFSEDAHLQILHYTNAAARHLKDNSTRFDTVILDSWHILHAAIKSGADTRNMFHLIQSDPEFEPGHRDQIWKAELFSMLPMFPMRKIVVSRSLSELFSGRYGIRSDVMELFVDDAYHSAEFNVRDRKKLKLISTSGDFNNPSKGLDFLIERLRRFDAFPFTLTLVNGGEIRRDLSELPFDVVVKSAKNPREMMELLVVHDIYVNTSVKESFCLSLAEALAVGMPAIALDSIGNRDYADGSNFVFVSDADTFNEKLTMMEDVRFRRMLSIRAKVSMRKYQLENTVNQFRKIVKMDR